MAKEDERSLARRDTGKDLGKPSSDIDIASTDLERIEDPELEDLLDILSQPTQALTTDDYLASIARRQEVVSKHLLRGGAERLRRFFELVKQRELTHPVKIDLSMLEISGKLLSGLYIPGANLEKLVVTESDLSGAFMIGASAIAMVGEGTIMRGAIATGVDFTDGVFPHADFSGGRFIGCRFINTVMTDVIVDEETNFTGSRFVGTYLRGTNLEKANTVGCTFRGLRR